MDNVDIRDLKAAVYESLVQIEQLQMRVKTLNHQIALEIRATAQKDRETAGHKGELNPPSKSGAEGL